MSAWQYDEITSVLHAWHQARADYPPIADGERGGTYTQPLIEGSGPQFVDDEGVG